MSKPLQYIIVLLLAIIAIMLTMIVVDEYRKTPLEKATDQIEKSIEGVQKALEQPTRQ